MKKNLVNSFRSLGPGILFATAAIGASHLVQSTTAGARYGFSLLIVVIITMLVKYPFFQYGPRYTAATHETLLDGYLRISPWLLGLFVTVTVITMFIVIATVTLVAAGIAPIATGIQLSPLLWSIIIATINCVILATGRFYLLDDIIKFIAIILAIFTVLAVILAFFQVKPNGHSWFAQFDWYNHLDVVFLIALIGWMPCPIDSSAWNSMWAAAKAKQLGHFVPWPQAKLDFNIGYYAILFLAICFLALGALTMYGKSMPLATSGIGFAKQLIGLYTNSLGTWAKYIIAIAAFTTMYSTTLACLDAYARVLSYCQRIYYHRDQSGDFNINLYRALVVIISIGALLIISFFVARMRTLVTIAMVVSFLTAPVIAAMNYLLVTGKHMPKTMQPGKLLRIISWLGIGLLCLFTLWFIIVVLPVFL